MLLWGPMHPRYYPSHHAILGRPPCLFAQAWWDRAAGTFRSLICSWASWLHGHPLPSPIRDTHRLQPNPTWSCPPSWEEHVPLGFCFYLAFSVPPQRQLPSSTHQACLPSFHFPKLLLFFLRQIIQLKKSPSIKICVTSSCLSKTMTFSPL